MPTDCVKKKVEAYRKAHNGRNPNHALVSQYQSECYPKAESLRIRKARDRQATEEAKRNY